MTTEELDALEKATFAAFAEREETRKWLLEIAHELGIKMNEPRFCTHEAYRILKNRILDKIRPL